MLQSSSRGGLPFPGGFSLVQWGSPWSRRGGGYLPGPGGDLPLPGGVLLGRGGVLETPPVDRITDTCKNITLATISLRPVKIC